MTQQKLLVTGASGKLGQLVIESLLKKGISNIIATTRNPEKLADLTKKGVDVRAADFSAPDNLNIAFRGADRLLLISTDAIGSRVEQHKNAIVAAKTAGVKHIIYTSWPKPDVSPALVSPEHLATEKMIIESGMSYTILRNFAYAENLLMSLPNAIQMGSFYGTAAQGKVAYVTKQDCAEAAVGALLAADTKSSVLNITGPKAYSYEEVLSIVKEITGKTISYVDLPEAAFKQALIQSGLPDMWAHAFVSFDLSYRQGDLAELSDSVEKLSGKKPQDLKEFLKANLKPSK